MNNLYHYKAKVTKVYDGDTITVDIDLGLGIWLRKQSIRLHGINAPEIRGEERPEGLKSGDFLRDLLLGEDVLIQTIKDKTGKYGRYIAKVEIDGRDVCDLLVFLGYAEYKEY